MERSLLHDVPPDSPLAARTRVVASLIVDSHTAGAAGTAPVASAGPSKTRPLIHLATNSGTSANDGDVKPAYALGIPISGNTVWNEIGHLDLDTPAIERVLLAGLCVLAMKHVREAGVQIGDAVLVGNCCEAYSLLQQELRRRFPDTTIVCMNLINGAIGYLPPAELYDINVNPVWQTPFDRGSLELVLETMTQAIRNVLED